MAILNETEKEALQEKSERSTKGAQYVSNWLQTFSANTTLGTPSLVFINSTTGSGSITAPTQNVPWVGLTTTTASGDKVIYQSKIYQRYWAYRTHRVSFAVSFAEAQANYRQRAGQFDDNDGWFFQFDTSGLSVVHRTSTSGSPVDTVVNQVNFNQSSGPAGLVEGVDYRYDRGITFSIAYNWYGTQIIKFAMHYGGSVVPLHDFVFTGQLDGVPFSRTAQLPIRFETENTDTAAAGKTMRIGSVSHSVADDSATESFYKFSASNGTTAVAATSTTVWQDILAVRPKATVNSIQNRGLLKLAHWQLLVENNSIEYRIIDNVTYTGGSWTSAGDESIAEYSVSPGTQVGTPRVIDINYAYSGRTSGTETPENSLGGDLSLGLNSLTGTQEAYVIQARKLSATDANVYAALTWAEAY